MTTIPKAGKFDYPFYDLNKVLVKLEKIHTLLREDEIDRGVVADALGMSESGGGFMYVIASMEKYGLVKTGSGKVLITQLAKVALYGEDVEKKRAKHKAILNVEIFRSIYEQFGKQVTIDQVRAFLRQKAFVEVDKAQKIAERVSKIYKKVSNLILDTEKTLPVDAVHPTPTINKEDCRKERMLPIESQGLKIQYRNVLIQIPQDDVEAIEFAEKALAFMKKEILAKTTSKEK